MLDTLPAELLCGIVELFCPHCCEPAIRPAKRDDLWKARATQGARWSPVYQTQRRTLLDLCLTSRRLRATAQPVLFHDFMPAPNRPPGKQSIVSSFVRVLALRPDLANAVRKAFIESTLLCDIVIRDALTSLELAEEVTGLHIIPPALVTPSDYALPDAPGGDEGPTEDALLHALFSLLPNLSQLEFMHPDSMQFYSLPFALGRSPSLTNQSLKSLTLSHYDDAEHGLSTVERVLNMIESLETLTLLRCTRAGIFGANPSMARLKSLRLYHSWLQPEDLDSMLGACRDLESFAYAAAGKHMEFVPLHGEGGGHFDAADAVQALQCHRETLKWINLDLSGCRYDPDAQTLPSLKDFIVLESLSINLDTLFIDTADVDDTVLVGLLPNSLSYLGLISPVRQYVKAISVNLVSLASAVHDGQFPNLKQIRLKRNIKHPDLDLDTLFAELGINVQWEIR